MSYPRIEIDLEKIKENTSIMVKECRRRGIEVAGVTKVFCGHKKIAEAMIEGGVSILADSRIENLKRLSGFKLPKMLIRIPMLSQVSRVVKYADISLVSDLETIRGLSKEAIKQDKLHKIILMIDLGDLREGVFYEEELKNIVKGIIPLKGISLYGVGSNLTCLAELCLLGKT